MRAVSRGILGRTEHSFRTPTSFVPSIPPVVTPPGTLEMTFQWSCSKTVHLTAFPLIEPACHARFQKLVKAHKVSDTFTHISAFVENIKVDQTRSFQRIGLMRKSIIISRCLP
jgi:hypothetical protein